MTPVALMIIGGLVFVTFVFVTIANFGSMAKANMRAVRNFSFDSPSPIGQGMGKHLAFGFIAMLGALAFVGGLAWFLVDKFAK